MGAKLRIIIRNQSEGSVFYWIKRTKSGVLGWFSGPSFARALEMAGSADLHFNYPESGELHYSLRARNEDGTEIYVSAYRDRVKRKVVSGGVRTVTEVARDHDEDMFTVLMPRMKLPTLSTFGIERHFFNFPTLGLNIIANDVPFTKRDWYPIDQLRLTGRDLVVDAPAFGDGTLNMWATLRSPEADVANIPNSARLSISDTSAVPAIDLVVFHQASRTVAT